jgi:hypothetical protein
VGYLHGAGLLLSLHGLGFFLHKLHL